MVMLILYCLENYNLQWTLLVMHSISSNNSEETKHLAPTGLRW